MDVKDGLVKRNTGNRGMNSPALLHAGCLLLCKPTISTNSIIYCSHIENEYIYIVPDRES